MPYANKEVQRQFQRVWKRERKNRLNGLKTKPCTDCGISYPSYVMEWDHLPGFVKVNMLSKMVQASPKRISAEIAKCELVCANCHRERTHRRTNS